MNDATEQALLKQALMLDIKERTLFLDAISDPKLKQKIEYLLQDDTELTAFMIGTAAGSNSLKQPNIQDLKPGDKIQRILIIKLIAKGGMGSVYLAYDERLKRNVAVKTIRAELTQNASSRQRFEQEAQILSQINHPSICQIYDYIEADHGDLLVLELVQGKTLKHHDLPYDQLLDALIQIASALCAAHEKGVIHRDLKPDNIMLTADGKIKVLDFGIAKSQGHKRSHEAENNIGLIDEPISQNITKLGSLMGTLVYMSPEQASTLPITEASDLYSFGIIMQELLTGTAAYRLENTEDLRNQVINATPIAAESLSKDFQELILALTQKLPTSRPTAQQVLHRLQQIKNKPEELKLKKRNAAFVSLIVLLLVFVWWQWDRFKQKESKINWITETKEQIDINQKQLTQVYSLPKHDITNSKLKISQRQKLISERIHANPALAEHEKNKLLGESYFAIAEYADAVKYFQAAWDLGDQTSEMALDLARAHDLLYWQYAYHLTVEGLSEFEQQRLLDINKAHLEKARWYYQFDGENKEPQSSLIKAHSLFFSGEYQQALDALDKATAAKEGDYLVFEFEGRIYRTLYNQLISDGETDKAMQHLRLAENAFKQAISYGRSYPQPYASLCHVQQLYIENAIYRTGEDPTAFYHQAAADCKQLMDINPRDSYAFNSMATNAYRLAEWMNRNGIDATDMLAEALMWNQQSMELNPDAIAYETKAIIHDIMALKKQESGQNPLADIALALKAYDKVLALDPSRISKTTGNICYAMVVKFQHLLAHGQPMFDDLAMIDELLQREQASPYKKDTHYSSLYGNLGYVYLLAAYSHRQHNQPVEPWVNQSLSAYQHSIDASKSNPFAFAGMADNQVLLAEMALASGQDTGPIIEEATKRVKQSLAISQGFYWPILTQGNIEKLKARDAINKELDPIPYINTGHEYFKHSIGINPKYAPTHVFHAELYYLEMQAVNHKQQQSAFDQAVAAINQALAIDENIAEAWLLKAKLLEFALEHQIKHTAIHLSHQQLMDKAQAINPMALLSL